jgi:hypothetical protein
MAPVPCGVTDDGYVQSIIHTRTLTLTLLAA